jgi:anti-anti-sigma regulatory factor
MADNKTNEAATNAELLVLALENSVDVSRVERLRADLAQMLSAPGSAAILDAAQVERVDAAALQLLACFWREARAQKRNVQWRQPSAAMLRSARLLGLTDAVGLSNAAA